MMLRSRGSSFHNRHRLIAVYFLCALVAMLFLSITASAEDRKNSAGKSAASEGSPPPPSQVPVDQSQEAPPRWTVSADALILNRIGNINRTLVERVPGSVPLPDLSTTRGTAALNSNNFQPGFAPGARLAVIRHSDSGYDLEVLYFQTAGWSSARSVGPDNPPDWLVMRAPGGFLQTQDHSYQAMAWDYDTKLFNAEFNLRWNLSSRLTLLAGCRWVQLAENLQGSLVPLEGFKPFWNSSTNNNLFGLQIGADGKIWGRGRFSINGLVKAGAYLNHAAESTGVSIFKVLRPSSTTTNHAAFVGEIGLQCKYQVSKALGLKVGYEALWLAGVALAPGQIQETYTIKPDTVRALGVSLSGVFFHGATAGLAYSF
ncbi:MAG: BBP7 family outer membrane beta-barrel protein [Desulfobaccales bacterium]